MPTYEYECRSCHHKFELFQNITAKPITRCPKCKKAKVRRLIGMGAGIIFKGSGFYQTDYRSDHYKKQLAADKPDAQTSKPADAKAVAGKSVSNDGAKAGGPANAGAPANAGGSAKPEKAGTATKV